MNIYGFKIYISLIFTGNTFTKKNLNLDEELDEYKCPKLKIALLYGPPGLGKTTLAHLVARQAGKYIFLFKI